MSSDTRNLRTHLPNAGFRWRDGENVVAYFANHSRPDRYIVERLAQRGDCPALAPGAKGSAKAQVDAALARMFKAGTAQVREDIENGQRHVCESSIRIPLYVAERVPWADENLTGSQTFFTELWYEIYKARGRWHEEPCFPFDISKHGELAHAVDEYHEAMGGGHWMDYDLEKFLGKHAKDWAGGDGYTEPEANDDTEMREAVDDEAAEATSAATWQRIQEAVKLFDARAKAKAKDADGDVMMGSGSGAKKEEPEDEEMTGLCEDMADVTLECDGIDMELFK